MLVTDVCRMHAMSTLTSPCFLLAVCLISATLSAAEELLSIHGFVRVGVALSSSQTASAKMTQVRVDVYTPSGVRVLETDCAPNGYFFIPIDKPGRYIIKPKGIQRWSFRPSQKTVECGASQCNAGEDVIFEVNGFSINGKVVANEISGCDHQTNSAMASIKMLLHASGNLYSATQTIHMCSCEADGTELATVYCRRDGTFFFDGAMPGSYLVYAEHSSWKLIGPDGGIPVQLGWESIVMESAFKVEGFNMGGTVAWKGHPIPDVLITLSYRREEDNSEESLSSRNDLSVWATGKTDLDGRYSFSDVPCGIFMVTPRYTPAVLAVVPPLRASIDVEDGSSIEFDPESLTVDVPMGDLSMAGPIEVASFSIIGAVLHQKTNRGIPGVRVSVGLTEATTNEKGLYVLHRIHEARLDIEFEITGMAIPRMNGVEVSPLTRVVPVAFPTAYSVCGSVNGSRPNTQKTFAVQLTRSTGSTQSAETDADGNYCFSLEPGSYQLEVKYVVVFTPRSRTIEVVDSPLSNIQFIQKKVKLNVSVRKLPESEWGLVVIALTSLSDTSVHRITSEDLTVHGDVASCSTNDLSPGDYTVEVSREGWCWKEKKTRISVEENDVEAHVFQQSGIEKKLMMTHDATLYFSGPGTELIKDGFYQKGKVHSLCFSSSTPHVVNAKEDGCFVFDKDMSIDPTEPATLAISASKYKARGSIKLPSVMDTTEVVVNIRSKTTGNVQAASVISESSTGKIVYEFVGSLGEQQQISPSHDTLLFHPESVDFSYSGMECPPEVQPFVSKHGTIITGEIIPPISGTDARLILGDAVLAAAKTFSNGLFSFGPFYDLDPDAKLEIEKQGYEFVIQQIDTTVFRVTSVRMVKVDISIQMDKEDKSGVWVALAGTHYGHRNNGQTGKDGVVSFWKLPSDSYYIKPIIKEYEFIPPFQQIEVNGSQDERIEFVANRTGFSAYGAVTSRTGQQLAEISIIAKSDEYEESCVSDKDGQFHLQNLKPARIYNISVKTIGAVRSAWPDVRTLSIPFNSERGVHTDVADLYFVAYKCDQLPSVDCRYLRHRDDGTINVNGILVVDRHAIPTIEVQILKTVRSDGRVRLIATLKPYFNGWIEAYLTFPGRYTFKVFNRDLEKRCYLPSTTITLDATSPKEVHIGLLVVDCTIAAKVENVDHGTSSYWPVMFTVTAILAVVIRAMIRGMGPSSE